MSLGEIVTHVLTTYLAECARGRAHSDKVPVPASRFQLDNRVFRHFLSAMKAMLAATLVLGCSLALAVAQNPPAKAPPANTAAATASAAASTNKPDIKELVKAASFTNDTGIVMMKISPILWAGKFEVTQEEYQKV